MRTYALFLVWNSHIVCHASISFGTFASHLSDIPLI